MKKPLFLIPFVCSLPILTGCATSSNTPIKAENGLEIQPFTRVGHSAQRAGDYFQLGRFYQGQNRLEKAANAYRKALKISPNHLKAQNALGKVYAKQGRLEEAVAIFKSLTESQPSMAKAYNNLGYAYFLQGKYIEAIATYETALSLSPQNQRTWNNISTAFSKTGNNQKSHHALARASELNKQETKPIARKRSSTKNVLKHNTIETIRQVRLPELHARNIESSNNNGLAKNISYNSGSLALMPPAGNSEIAQLPAVSPQKTSALPKMANHNINTLQPLSLHSLVDPNSTPITLNTKSGITLKDIQSVKQERKLKNKKTFKLEVANGNGITGMAKRTSHALIGMGLPTARLTNIRPFQQPKTVIRYRTGHLKQALHLQKQLKRKPVLVIDKRLDKRTDVQLVLGRDVVKQAMAYHAHKTVIKITANMHTPLSGFES